MQLLGSALYDPAGAVSKATSALLAMTAFDTSNLRIAFTIPASGIVLVRMHTMLEGATTFPQVMLGVLEGATVRGRVVPTAALPGTALATTRVPLEAQFIVRGLTPGAVNWDAAYAVEVIVASTNIKYGGPNTNATADDAYGAFCFEVWDPSPLPPNITLQSIDANGRVDVIKVAGTTQTARDIGASVLVGDKTGFSLSAGGVQAIWDALTAALTTANSIGKRLADFITGDAFVRLGAPAGASVSADVAAVKALLPAALVGGRIDASVGAMAANVLTATAINADAITNAKIADDAIAVENIKDAAITAAKIASDAITDAKVAADVTIASVSGAVGSVTGAVGSVTGNVGGNVTGSIGSLAAQAKLDVNAEADTALADYDAPTHTELTAELATADDAVLAQVALVKAQTDNLPSDPADASVVAGLIAAVEAKVDTVDSNVDAILVDTAEIGAAGAGLSAVPWNAAWDAEVQSEATDALNAYDPPTRTEATADKDEVIAAVGDVPTNAELATALGTADDAVLAAIAALNNLSQANVRTAIGLASANLDTQLDALPTNAELATALGTADDAVLAAIAALNNLSQANVRSAVGLASANLDTQLDALPTNAELATALGTADDAVLAAIAALSVPSAAANAAALLAAAYEGAESVQDYLRLSRSVLMGAVTGGPTTPAFKSKNGSTTRVTATVDGDGNRSSVTVDPA